MHDDEEQDEAKDTNDDEVDNEGAIMQHFFLPIYNNRGKVIAFISYIIIDI